MNKMKKIILPLIMISFLISCKKNQEPKTENTTNKVVLLKVDFLTNVFEGGKELNFSPSCSFTISSTYQEPGDFGSVQLFYSELNEMLFDGTIIWMGTGQIAYPIIDPPSSFSTTSNSIHIPNSSLFEKVMYDQYAYYPETISYSDIWNAISNLEIVEAYRNSNPNGKVNLFLYTPSVGVGDPAEWDWFVILNN